MESSNFRALGIKNLEEIRALEEAQISHLDEIEKMNISWNASWRTESLEHYLKSGWCMGRFDEKGETLVAYFLAQPFLYMETLPQTLWVEHIFYPDLNIARELVEFVYRYAKEKYLQRILFFQKDIFEKMDPPFKITTHKKDFIEVHTTKMI